MIGGEIVAFPFPEAEAVGDTDEIHADLLGTLIIEDAVAHIVLLFEITF